MTWGTGRESTPTRRRVLAAGLAAVTLTGCGARDAPVTVGPDQALPLQENEGLVALVVRRVAVEGCRDQLSPRFTVARANDPQSRWFDVEKPTEDWQPDLSEPHLIRQGFLLRLPAGIHAILGATAFLHGASYSARLPPCVFEVRPGRALYVGSLGIRTQYVRHSFGCSTQSGEHGFFFAVKPERDLPFLAERFPQIRGIGPDVVPARAPRWPASPTAVS